MIIKTFQEIIDGIKSERDVTPFEDAIADDSFDKWLREYRNKKIIAVEESNNVR